MMWSQQPEASPSPSPVGNPSAPRWTSCSLIQPLQSPGPQRITSPGRHDSIDSNWSQKATEKAVFFMWFIYVYICLKQCSEIYLQPAYDKIGSTTKGVYPQAVQAFPRWIKGGSSRDLPRVSGKHDRFTVYPQSWFLNQYTCYEMIIEVVMAWYKKMIAIISFDACLGKSRE